MTHSPLVCGIIEANIPFASHLPTLQITDYNLELDDRFKLQLPSRTILYILKGTKYRRRRDFELLQLSAICIEVNFKCKNSWLLWIGYREWEHPLKNTEHCTKSLIDQTARLQLICELWQKMALEKKPLVILGDLNVDVRPWTHINEPISLYQQSQSTLLNLIKNTVSELDLMLSVTGPTRVQGTDQTSTIDLVISSLPTIVSQLVTLPSSSDHSLMVFQVNHNKQKVVKTVRKF